MHTLALRAQSSVDAERTTIYQIDRAANEIFSRVALGLDPNTVIRLPLSRGLIGFVARTGRTLRLRDAYNDPRFDQSTDRRTGYRTRSMLCVPITATDGTVIGAIQAINKYNGVFTDSDERELLALCPEVAHLLTTERPHLQDAGRAQQA
jgi:adenylate cyclase